MRDFLSYKDKTCVITGAAFGTGRALADSLMELGARVWALDMYDVPGVTRYIKTNLCHPEQVEAAIAALPDKIDRLFSNAALPGTVYLDRRYSVEEVFTANYVSARYLIECLAPRMPAGSSITVTSSVVGAGWAQKLDLLRSLYDTGPAFGEALEWAKQHGDDPGVFDGGRRPQPLYIFTKEALHYFVKRSAYDLLLRGIRINCVSPGAIDSAMTPDFGRLLEEAGEFEYMEEYAAAAVGPAVGRAATPQEIADCLLLLGSDLSAGIAGASLDADFGFRAAVDTGLCTEGGRLLL